MLKTLKIRKITSGQDPFLCRKVEQTKQRKEVYHVRLCQIHESSQIPHKVIHTAISEQHYLRSEISKYLSEVKEFDKAKVEYARILPLTRAGGGPRFKIDLFVPTV